MKLLNYQALRMWEKLSTYDEIAVALKLPNGGAAERVVSEARSARRGLPIPYESPFPERLSA